MSFIITSKTTPNFIRDAESKRVDLSNRYGSYCNFLFAPGHQIKDLSRGNNAITTHEPNAVPSIVDAGGKAKQFDSGANDGFYRANTAPALWTSTTNNAMLARFTCTSAAYSGRHILSGRVGTSGDRHYVLMHGGALRIKISHGATNAIDTTVDAVVGKTHTLVKVWKGDNFIVGIDGKAVLTSSATIAGGTVDTMGIGMLGNGADTGDSWKFEGNIHLAAIISDFPVAFTEADARSLSADPYQLFMRQPRRTYFMPSAGGGPTVYNRSVAETFSTADADTRTATFARDLAEALALVDASSRTATFDRAIAEALALVDASGQSVDGAGAYEREVAEALTFVDASTRTAVYERLIAEALAVVDAASFTGGQVAVSTGGGQSMTLRQMRRLEREQLLAMIREDDEVIIALVSQLLAKGRSLN